MKGGERMALFEVYYVGPKGRTIGDSVTMSRATAIERVETLAKEGKDAWYEQIQ